MKARHIVQTCVFSFLALTISAIPTAYAAPFLQSPATYTIHGDSTITVQVISTGQIINLSLDDPATVIAASAPFLNGSSTDLQGAFVPVPPPLPNLAPEPLSPPPNFNSSNLLSEIHMQVVSMVMTDGVSNLLIGIPYANKYPSIFFDQNLFVGNSPAFSFGEMESMILDTVTGFPARSYFDVFHILETPFGTFFNKQFSQMLLEGALNMPPDGQTYDLINGPIDLFDVNNPNGLAVARVINAHHHLIATVSVQPVPEPSTWLVLATGLVGLLGYGWRQRKNAA